MEIIEYSEKWKDKWDLFVLESNNGTMFHLQKFFDYHKPGKFTFNHLIFLDKGNIAALLPGALIGDTFESPIGASYGSIVTKDVKFAEAMDIVSTLFEYGRKVGIKEFVLTSAPRVYERHPNENFDFAMLWQGFNYDLHYISSAIKLEPNMDAWAANRAQIQTGTGERDGDDEQHDGWCAAETGRRRGATVAGRRCDQRLSRDDGGA